MYIVKWPQSLVNIHHHTVNEALFSLRWKLSRSILLVFQTYNTVFLTIGTMVVYNTSQREMFITEVWNFWTSSPICSLQTPTLWPQVTTHPSVSISLIFFFKDSTGMWIHSILSYCLTSFISIKPSADSSVTNGNS